MERRFELDRLLDFYGPLLTKSRGRIMRLWCEEDLSMQEIADEEGVSRQAVHDAIRNAENKLRYYEEKLGMAGRYSAIMDRVDAIAELLKGVSEPSDEIKEALRLLDGIKAIEG